MAKREITGTSKAETIRVEGSSRPRADGRVDLIVEIDGRATTSKHNEATHQEAVYVATLKAMRRAHKEEVTDLSIDSPNNLVDGHITKGWARNEPRLHTFQSDILELTKEFDSVVWVRSANEPAAQGS